MKYIKNILFYTICILFLHNCKSQKNIIDDNYALVISEEITLLKTIPGGSRGHIISVSHEGNLSYGVGSISNFKDLNNDSITYNEKYKMSETSIKKNKILELEKLLKQKNLLHFEDELIVKDNWQYYLYINGKLIAFGYENNFTTYPSNLQSLINILLENTGKLHKIPGMS